MGLRIIDRNTKMISAVEYDAQRQAQLKDVAAFWSKSIGASTKSNEAGFIERVEASLKCIEDRDAAQVKAVDVNSKIRSGQDSSLKLQAHLDFETLVKLLQ